MYTLIDAWHEKYFNEDGTVNKKCHYFDGVNQDNKQRILDAYFLQDNIEKIVEILPVGKVKKEIIKKSYYKPTGRKQKAIDKNNLIIGEYNQGKSPKEISFDLGLKYQYVCNIIHKSLL